MYKFLLVLLLSFSILEAKPQELKNNPFITKRARDEIAPFMLPSNHPLKSTVENLFGIERVTLNEEAFANAGFVTLYSQPRSFIKVARHPLLPGYLVKTVLDSEPRQKKGMQSWEWFVRRCVGAKLMQKVIRNKRCQYFIVPQKYLHPLPAYPEVPDNYSRQIAILLVEELDLVSEEENLLAWKTKITKEHLKELYSILTHSPGITLRPDNIVYTTDGKFAFIDTEYLRARPYLSNIKHYLSDEMKAYWSKLRKKGKNY
ncbi:MAG: hypothetical protein WC222_06300 [Parachlamydiales bacterium]|jgi:hypothetical protein